MIRFTYIFIVFIAFNLSALDAQQLDHKLGQVIVEVAHDRAFSALKSELTHNYRSKSIVESKQIMAEPQNLWLLTVDHAQVDENKFLEKIVRSKYSLQAQKNKLIEYRNVPNDPLFLNQWQFLNESNSSHDLDVVQAWDHMTGGVTTDGDTIVVAVIDSGVQYDHEDLSENMWVNHAEIPNNGIDDDANGYVDDYLGYSAYSGTDEINSVTYHGTEVSGIIGAKGNNGIGVSGVNWDVKVMFIQGGGDEVAALAAYAYPYSMRKKYNESNGAEGAFVVATNSSWGINLGDPAESPLWCDFYDIMGEEGIISCGATANANNNVDTQGDLPTGCSSDYLISVTNINMEDVKAVAGFGVKTIDLGAYGSDTYTINDNNRYGAFGGTSGATPHVTGTVGLIYSMDCPEFMTLVNSNPAKAALAIKDFILNGVVPNESLSDITTTEGKLNINNAVLNALNYCSDECLDALAVNYNSVDYDEQNITFETGNGSGSVNIRYRKVGTSQWTEEIDISSPHTLDNWDLCSEYQVQLGSECGGEKQYHYSRYYKSGGCCLPPTIESEEIVNDQAKIEWTNDDAINSAFILQYREIESSNWQTVNLTLSDLSYTIPVTLEACEYIDYRIKTICDIIPTESDYSDIIRVFSDCGSCLSDYCEFSLDNSGEFITSVSIEGIFENSTQEEQDGYHYFSDQEIVLRDLTDYKFNIEIAYGSTDYNENCVVFIDTNYDGIFQNSERVVDIEGFKYATEANFTIPELTTFGNTRMRVIMLFDPIGGGCQSDDQRYGEVEDYCIELVSHLSCPSTLSIEPEDGDFSEEEQSYIIDTKDNNFTTIKVGSNGLADQYIVSLKRQGDEEYTDFVSETPEVIVNIDRCSQYQIKASAQCSDGEDIETEEFNMRTLCGSRTDNLNINAIKLYPNPGVNFTIETELYIDYIEIIDIHGKSHGQFDTAAKATEYSDQLAPGIYFINLRSGELNGHKKWIKL